ncbi:MAG: hypothetical protein HYV63_27680 [Candidatus Schekmanbacteria bacterium]|nr:hypothetical protein [Candidatus Schekmanbacteria bacterium]
MTLLQNSRPESISDAHLKLESSEAFRCLSVYVEQEMSGAPDEIAEDFAGIEVRLRDFLNRCGSEITAALIGQLDVRANGIVVDEKAFRRRREDGSAEIMSTFGPTQIAYALYEERGGHGGKLVAPLKMRIGLVSDFWTPRAASIAALFVQATTPAEAHRLLVAAAGMTASASSLDRLPKLLNEVAEENRQDIEAEIRAVERLPEVSGVACIAVSLDGVMTPLKDAKTEQVGAGKAAPTQRFKEAGCGTISLYDGKGKRLHTIRLARMPESHKVTLHAQLEAELAAIRERYPQAVVVAVADGAEENSRIIRETVTTLGIESTEEIIDFFHAMEHAAEALRAYASSETIAKADIALWHDKLIADRNGVADLIRALRYRRDHSSAKNREIIEENLGYFEKHRHQMCYAAYRARHLPIGSGVQEAACKTLVTQRLKRSGMSWRIPGGQAILTLRSWNQSNRFEHAL